MDRHKHCGFCGTAFGDTTYPRHCRSCNKITYDTPTPVVICLQPVRDGDRLGLAIAQRAILPNIGGWSLIAGHIEPRESVEQAGAREFIEETSIGGAKPRLLESNFNDKGHLLIITESDPIPYSVFKFAKPCHENLEIDVLWEWRELTFPIHSRAAKRWFERNKR